ncbi:hypothetical protein [Cupriavidus taiwanensis]|uniref:glycine-rich domain-containing protein n=1 Tax=Cupriavidus taiwanensis TaxID=164546 RepID=UPI000E11D1E4|nr:hypothetical protein [Cupriavidus taiwanensis]SPA44598.1 hypothetical protein CBM2629_A150400 [Cupriavidus taiwanensis]
MTTQYLILPAKQVFEDSDGKPLVGGKLYTYDAGTSTLKKTYQDRGGASENTNPIILDARGECTVYGTGNYRIKLTDAADVTVWDRENVAVSTDRRYLGAQVFSASGTYTPSAGVTLVVVEVLGGGGAGGGAPATGVGQFSIGSGGGAGGYTKGSIANPVSGAVAVGAGGVGVSGANGGGGGASGFQGLITANGGSGGVASAAASAPAAIGGAGGSTPIPGNIVNTPGSPGQPGWANTANIQGVTGMGASSIYGAGGISTPFGNFSGSAGAGYGAGGSGAFNLASQSARAGGNGSSGRVIVHEYT